MNARLCSALQAGLLGLACASPCACFSTPPPQSGICIGPETLKQFDAGKTREAWVRAILGEPTSVATVADDPAVTVLRYSTMQQSDKSIVDSVLGTPGEAAIGTVYFIVRDGIVERFWADQMEGAKLFSEKSGSGEKKKAKDSG
jgi:hypothetical protein